MKNFPHIIQKVYFEPWLITVKKHRAIQRVLEAHIAGTLGTVRQGDERRYSLPSIGGETRTVTIDGEEPETPRVETLGATVVIPIHGIIGKHLSGLEMYSGGCDLDFVSAALREAEDPDVSRVILDIQSPGGTVTGVPECARAIGQLAEEKGVIAFSDSEMCSAAYWLASQCGQILVTESVCVGSIGVYLALLDESRALENEGLKVNAIAAGKWKLAGAPFRPLGADERAMFQADVDRIAADFKSAVTSKRKVADEFMEGQTFDGLAALRNGLVDDVIQDFEDLLTSEN